MVVYSIGNSRPLGKRWTTRLKTETPRTPGIVQHLPDLLVAAAGHRLAPRPPDKRRDDFARNAVRDGGLTDHPLLVEVQGNIRLG